MRCVFDGRCGTVGSHDAAALNDNEGVAFVGGINMYCARYHLLTLSLWQEN